MEPGDTDLRSPPAGKAGVLVKLSGQTLLLLALVHSSAEALYVPVWEYSVIALESRHEVLDVTEHESVKTLHLPELLQLVRLMGAERNVRVCLPVLVNSNGFVLLDLRQLESRRPVYRTVAALATVGERYDPLDLRGVLANQLERYRYRSALAVLR